MRQRLGGLGERRSLITVSSLVVAWVVGAVAWKVAGSDDQTSRITEASPSSASPSPSVRRPTLHGLIEQGIARFERLDKGKQGAHEYAWMAQNVATLRGWRDPQVKPYLAKVYAVQHEDGGYGVAEAWDAFQDGSVNPVHTTYAITLSDHVGPVLLSGWEAGVVPRRRVREVVDRLQAFPAASVDERCVAYSEAPADAGWCVGNVNASAAWFLTRADRAGFDVDLSRVSGMIEYDRSTLIDGEWWPYMSGVMKRQDWYHNATMVQAYMVLAPRMGRRALEAMKRASVDDAWERAALLRLSEFDCRLAEPLPLAVALEEYRDDAYYTALLTNAGALAFKACRA